MTREEATQTIEAFEGRFCVRLTQRRGGTVVAGNCRARLRAARRRGLLAFAGALLVLGAQAFGLRALVHPELRAAHASRDYVTMGKGSLIGGLRP